MHDVFQLTIYKYVLFFPQYIVLDCTDYNQLSWAKNTFFFIVLMKLYHSDQKAHIYRQENSAQQANTFK